ncbi:2-polyprenyl-6-methoxyphenol hydroxylase-like FAD-dependent oxidoreductase [Streptomyces sp. TLI_235]|nr:NAD(P)/FAD-dependent oxidoreductase [Streptomyces sp. TLI_235]PBC66110.1 2-polyprenyl-6-methoxyphenol hydroxylase-like FAD-dependent oxidoreductase [Streptomyces sp. TLI_235]
MTTATTHHHPITVVGAGLGGLTLARILHVHGIEAVVLDLDASPTARHQGGMLDLHEDSAQLALRAAGLYEEFLAIIHPGGQAMRIIDRDGTVLLADEDGDSGGRPEVNRNDLRRILLDSLPAGTVRWGAKVTAARPLGGGRHELRLADGTTLTTDLLVGADGAWSRIRPLLSDAVPAYTGVSFVEADLRDAAVRHPATAELAGGGMMFALGDNCGILSHRETDGTLHAYVALRVPEDWAAGVDFTDTEAARAEVLQHFEGWDDRLRAMLADARGALVPRPIHALPVGHSWQRTAGVTLLGDAAHLMSPFAGEGANLAMLDAAELAAAIAARPGDTEAALAQYEKALFPRSEASAAESAGNLDLCFDENAPHGLIERMAAYQASA